MKLKVWEYLLMRLKVWKKHEFIDETESLGKLINEIESPEIHVFINEIESVGIFINEIESLGIHVFIKEIESLVICFWILYIQST